MHCDDVYFPVMKLEAAAKQLEALGNPTRLAIYGVLVRRGDDGCPVGEIRKKLDIPGIDAFAPHRQANERGTHHPAAGQPQSVLQGRLCEHECSDGIPGSQLLC
jgi:hypothetical protein